MKVFAIGDIHLSGNPPSHPMDVFGPHWNNHWERLQTSWNQKVGEQDIVLIVGDTSWALNLPSALGDLHAIATLPGRKFIIRGNHDYWWASQRKMTQALGDSFTFLQGHGTALDIGSKIIAFGGSRGYLCPNDQAFEEEHDQSIYARELLRIEAAFQNMDRAIANLQKKAKVHADKEVIKIALFHYPPFNDKNEASGFTQLMETYGIQHCVFGHLHDQASFQRIPPYFGAIRLHLVSSDYKEFTMEELNI